MSEHTTATIILSDGTHRTTSADHKLTYREVVAFFRQTVDLAGAPTWSAPAQPLWAFVAYGREHHQYTGNEVLEMARDPRYMDVPRATLQLSRLDVRDIDKALRASGYLDNRLVSAQFVGMTSTGLVAHYRVAFDDCGEEIVGDVYVRRHDDGQPRADF